MQLLCSLVFGKSRNLFTSLVVWLLFVLEMPSTKPPRTLMLLVRNISELP